MSNVAKHRGWLLIYEVQYWMLVVLTAYGVLVFYPVPIKILYGALIVAVIWAIPIFSLYRSTNAVRRGHVIWCWFLASIALFVAFNNSPGATGSAVWRGEFFGSAGIAVLWIVWALYWQKSKRAKNAYPATGKMQNI